MSNIHYLNGDATAPATPGNKIIAHICNDIGGWGKGFVLAISKKWTEPEENFYKWVEDGEDFRLGEIQMVPVTQDITICNMIGQRDIVPDKTGRPPIRYEAVEESLEKLSRLALKQQATVHMPRIGCGLAGGDWSHIEAIIQRTLIASGVEVYIYDLD